MRRRKQIDEFEEQDDIEIDPNELADLMEEEETGYRYEEDDGLKELDFDQ